VAEVVVVPVYLVMAGHDRLVPAVGGPIRADVTLPRHSEFEIAVGHRPSVPGSTT
jgi:hypothetical protein